MFVSSKERFVIFLFFHKRGKVKDLHNIRYRVGNSPVWSMTLPNMAWSQKLGLTLIPYLRRKKAHLVTAFFEAQSYVLVQVFQEQSCAPKE